MTLTPCHVIIPVGSTTLLLTTSAAHALEILSGATIFSPDNVDVVDSEGNSLTSGSLLRMRDADAAVLLTTLDDVAGPKVEHRRAHLALID